MKFQFPATAQRLSKAIQSPEGSPPHFSRILCISERKGSSRLCRVPLSTHQRGDLKTELAGSVSLYGTSAADEPFMFVCSLYTISCNVYMNLYYKNIFAGARRFVKERRKGSLGVP